MFGSVFNRSVSSSGAGNIKNVATLSTLSKPQSFRKSEASQILLSRYYQTSSENQSRVSLSIEPFMMSSALPNLKSPTKLSPLNFFKSVLSSNRLNCNSVYFFYILGLLPRPVSSKKIRGHNLAVTAPLFRTNAVMPQKVKKALFRRIVEVVKVYQFYDVLIAHSMISTIFADSLRARIAVVPYDVLCKSSHRLLLIPVKPFKDKYFRFHKKIGIGFFLNEAITVAIACIVSRDPALFLNYFSRRMEKVNFFKHRAYVDFYRRLFWDLYKS